MPKHILKKSQIQLGESTTIVLIIMILLIIGFAFYAYLRAENMKKDAQLFNDYEQVQLTLLASNMPELLCSQRGIVDSNCYDWLKILALKDLIAGNDPQVKFYYSEYFGKSTINISRVYPAPEEEITLYDAIGNSNYSSKTIPVLIYDPSMGGHYFGLIEIGRE